MVFLWKKQNDIRQACYEFVEKDIQKIFKEAKIILED